MKGLPSGGSAPARRHAFIQQTSRLRGAVMLPRMRSSVLMRTAVVGLGVTLLVGLAALGLAGRIAHRRETAHQREVMEALVDVVEPSASAACFMEDRAMAREVVRGLVKTRNVESAFLRAGNRVLAQAGRADGPGQAGERVPLTRQLYSPLAPGGALGDLTVVPDPRESEQQVARTVNLVRMVVLSLILALGLALGITVHQSVARPLSVLSRQLHQVEGEKGLRLDLPRGHERDEIGRLVRAMNTLVERLVTSSQDLHTANARLGEALVTAEAASHAKSRFLATISHEIRTPMNGIMGMTSLLLDTRLTRRQRHFGETVRDSAAALLELINDILDFSRMEAGRLELDLGEFQIRPLLAGVVALLAPRAKNQDIKLTYAIPLAVKGVFLGDAGRLRQILINLVGNALKFTEQGSVTIVVAMSEEAGCSRLRVEVSDTGIGIPQAARANLFTMFTQADATTARRYGGSGLGLAISRRLVDLMGGEIGFTSEEGVGSTFWFRVPLVRRSQLAEEDEPAGLDPIEVLVPVQGKRKAARAPRSQAVPAPPAMPAPASAPARQLRKVLVADDNPTNQEVAVALLELLKVPAETAFDGQEAVAMVAQSDYSMILMDVQMPRVDGLAATRMIRALAGGKGRVPIIAMTANAQESDRQECLEAGMDDYLAKPIDRRRLKAILERWNGAAADMPIGSPIMGSGGC